MSSSKEEKEEEWSMCCVCRDGIIPTLSGLKDIRCALDH